jgi:hypothetical protein
MPQSSQLALASVLRKPRQLTRKTGCAEPTAVVAPLPVDFPHTAQITIDSSLHQIYYPTHIERFAMSLSTVMCSLRANTMRMSNGFHADAQPIAWAANSSFAAGQSFDR